jgi:hypothetical protein
MKTVLLCVVFMIVATAAKAQLANTKWSGLMNVPTQQNVILDFKTDTVKMILPDNDGYVGETMLYSVKDSVITLKKVDGNSPCDQSAFTLTYAIKGNQLFVKTLSDVCEDRKNAWPATPFIKVN